MPQNDKSGPQVFDLLVALGFLTRLPVPIDGARAAARGAASAWAWPLVGVLVGSCGAAAGELALWCGLIAPLAAAAALAVQLIVTGALHEDGLADTADGLWGGWDRARRLAIMKDSHIGTYGVMALLLVTLSRWLSLAVLIAAGLWPVIIAAGAISRAPMAVIMAALPNARGTGLSHAVGRPRPGVVWLALALAILAGALCVGTGIVPMIATVAGTSLSLAMLARAKIGGQTGDILGASQQLAEVAVLVVAVAQIAP